MFWEGDAMHLAKIDKDFSVCRLKDVTAVDLNAEFCFVGKTDEEISLVCLTEEVPDHALQREDGWKAFRIQGVLDFSLIGVLAKISSLLAEGGIGIFVVSTYNTDYILTKEEDHQRALDILAQAGYSIDGSV